MADTKISALPAVTDVLATDEFVLARSSTTNKIDASDLATFFGADTGDGWYASSDTWTYASASTFTVAGDLTARFSKGTRLKFTQTTAKYAVVAGSSHAAGTTTVTIAVNTDYTIANAAITSPHYSYATNPQGYPIRFNYTPTWISSGTQPAIGNGTLTGKFSMTGGVVQVRIDFTVGSTSTFGTGSYTWSIPVTATLGLAGTAWVYDNGTAELIGRVFASGSSLGVHVQNGAATAYCTPTSPFTWATGDQVQAALHYFA